MPLLRAVTVLAFLVMSSTYSVIYSEKYALYMGKFWSHVWSVAGRLFRLPHIAKRCSRTKMLLRQYFNVKCSLETTLSHISIRNRIKYKGTSINRFITDFWYYSIQKEIVLRKDMDKHFLSLTLIRNIILIVATISTILLSISISTILLSISISTISYKLKKSCFGYSEN